jgi:hypothetical protein
MCMCPRHRRCSAVRSRESARAHATRVSRGRCAAAAGVVHASHLLELDLVRDGENGHAELAASAHMRVVDEGRSWRASCAGPPVVERNLHLGRDAVGALVEHGVARAGGAGAVRLRNDSARPLTGGTGGARRRCAASGQGKGRRPCPCPRSSILPRRVERATAHQSRTSSSDGRRPLNSRLPRSAQRSTWKMS